MKNCNDCQYFTNNICAKNSKNGYNNCHKFKAIPITQLIKERNELMISKENPERLNFLTEKIRLFEGY